MKSSCERHLRSAMLASSLVLSIACRSSVGVEPTAAISVRNLTSDSIAITVFERKDAALVEPVPERAAAQEVDRLVVPGGRRLVHVSQISGYRPGADIRIFLYRIQQGRSIFFDVRDVSAASLVASAFTVDIPASAFQQP